MHYQAILLRYSSSITLALTLFSISFGQAAKSTAEETIALPTAIDSAKTDEQISPRIKGLPATHEPTPTEDTAKTESLDARSIDSLTDQNTPTKQRQTSGYRRPPANTRFKLYKNSVIGPIALATNAGTAGISTITNSPEEWEKTGMGFAKRFASDFGRILIKNTTIYGLDEALKLDSNYYPSRKRSTGARIKHAVFSPVTAFDKNGEKVVGIPRIVGAYGSAVIARETWYPKPYGYKDGLKSGTITLGIRAAINLFKEFFLF